MDNQIDPRELRGEALFIYFTEDYPNAEYSSVVKLLKTAVSSPEKLYGILERCVKEGKVLVPVYPEDTRDVSKLEYVGEIPDGTLYLG